MPCNGTAPTVANAEQPLPQLAMQETDPGHPRRLMQIDAHTALEPQNATQPHKTVLFTSSGESPGFVKPSLKQFGRSDNSLASSYRAQAWNW